MIGVGNMLDVVGQIPWCQPMQTSVDKHSQIEINVLVRPQPLKVPEHWCDVIIPRGSMYQSGSGIEHRLVNEAGTMEPRQV